MDRNLSLENMHLRRQSGDDSGRSSDHGKGGSNRSKAVLDKLQERLSYFEKQVEHDTEQRRTSEGARLQSLKEATVTMEKTLNEEIRRRVEATKSLQTLFETQISTIQDKLESIFTEKLDSLQCGVKSMENRVEAVSEEIKEVRANDAARIADMNSRCEEAFAHVKALHGGLRNEQHMREEKEAVIMQQVAAVEKSVDSKLNAEKSAREQKYHTVRKELEYAWRQQAGDGERSQAEILEEISHIKRLISAEAQEREQADEDIAQALQHYTSALHSALKIVNTT